MSQTMDVVEPGSAEMWAEAKRLVLEYRDSLGVDLCFQHFDQELQDFEQVYSTPQGAFFLARHEGEFIGCVGMHRHDEGIAELKRLYVPPGVRGRGLGRKLVEAVIERAHSMGFQHLVLDTLPTMVTAQALYRSMGFRDVKPYRFQSVEGSRYLELDLRNQG